MGWVFETSLQNLISLGREGEGEGEGGTEREGRRGREGRRERERKRDRKGGRGTGREVGREGGERGQGGRGEINSNTTIIGCERKDTIMHDCVLTTTPEIR